MPASHESSYDLLVIGGGVIGLSIANEFSSHGASVCVVDRRQPGQEASWAGAGIIPPASWYCEHPWIQEMTRLSRRLYPALSHQLRELTGIDNGWCVCGGIYLSDNLARLKQRLGRWTDQGVLVEPLDACDLSELLTGVPYDQAIAPSEGLAGFWVPEEAQVRNPRHLAALVEACHQRGVRFKHTSVYAIDAEAPSVRTDDGVLSAGQLCLATGAWTDELSVSLGVQPGIFPVRGQMLLLRAGSGQPTPQHHVHRRGKYAVPRFDGRVLVGSTVERVGFDKSTTERAIAELRLWAAEIGLGSLQMEKCWAGLRPGTANGLPILGPVPGCDHVWIAAGHGRAGIQLAPATALIMDHLLRGLRPPLAIPPWHETKSFTSVPR
jgi:glycine oxidase